MYVIYIRSIMDNKQIAYFAKFFYQWCPRSHVTFAVIDTILPSSGVQPVKKKHRARVLEFFIDVAQECFNIGNFNSLMAIISEYMFILSFCWKANIY